MHRTYFTDKHVTECSRWEFQEYLQGIPSLLPRPSDTDSRQLKDRDKHIQVWWGEVSLKRLHTWVPSSDGVAPVAIAATAQPEHHPTAVLVISHRQKLYAL